MRITMTDVIARAEADQRAAIERVEAHADHMRGEFAASRAFEARMSRPSRCPVPNTIHAERRFQAETAAAIAHTHTRIRAINARYAELFAGFAELGA